MRQKNEREEMFLRELSELTEKYGIKICGCGCCGSPWLGELLGNDRLGEDLRFDDTKKKYFCS